MDLTVKGAERYIPVIYRKQKMYFRAEIIYHIMQMLIYLKMFPYFLNNFTISRIHFRVTEKSLGKARTMYTHDSKKIWLAHFLGWVRAKTYLKGKRDCILWKLSKRGETALDNFINYVEKHPEYWQYTAYKSKKADENKKVFLYAVSELRNKSEVFENLDEKIKKSKIVMDELM